MVLEPPDLILELLWMLGIMWLLLQVPLKGLFKGDIHVGISVDIDMDVDSDVAASIKHGGPLKGVWVSFKRGLGLI